MASIRQVFASVSAVALLAVTVRAVSSSQPDQAEVEARTSPQTYNGCYSTSYPLTEVGNWTYQTSSYCGNECIAQNAAVLGISLGTDCFCGAQLPPLSNKVDDSKCNTPCAGYGTSNCGGTGFWSVWLSGVDDSVGNIGGDSSSSSTSTATSSSTTSTPKIVTSLAPGTTVVVTQPAEHASSTPSAKSGSGGGSSNTAGIAAGVVVGVLGFAAIIGGVYYYLRARSRRQAVEDYQRSTQVQDFMRQNPRPAVPSFAAGDQRLDPFAGRRNSVGSLADNQDYSRRILRVANPDGH